MASLNEDELRAKIDHWADAGRILPSVVANLKQTLGLREPLEFGKELTVAEANNLADGSSVVDKDGDVYFRHNGSWERRTIMLVPGSTAFATQVLSAWAPFRFVSGSWKD